MSRVYCVAADHLTSGASVRLIARAYALASTGVPSLKRKLLRRLNVKVLPCVQQRPACGRVGEGRIDVVEEIRREGDAECPAFRTFRRVCPRPGRGDERQA